MKPPTGMINTSNTTIEYNVTTSQRVMRACAETAINAAGGSVSNNTALNDSSSTLGMTDPDNHDFSLTSSASDLIDKGDATYAPNIDYAGNARPLGTKHDIGAYEYTTQNAPPAVPLPPQNVRVRKAL